MEKGSSENTADLQNNSNPLFDYPAVIVFIIFAMFIAGLYSFHSKSFTPMIYDERSYLFQAQTFLLGQTKNPIHPEHLFFDSYHIINEGIFVSKYFPGFALTLAPFVLWGIPFLNPVAFYGLVLFLTYLIGKDLFDQKTAWLAIFLTALSPMMVAQVTFLQTHLPCAAFFLIFLWAYIQTEKRESSINWEFLMGVTWGFSFLIRPVTAIGFSIPFVVRFFFRRNTRPTFQKTTKLAALWIPILISICMFFLYNKTITNSFLKTPFSLYAEIHAPYDQYGFNNREKYAHWIDGPRVNKKLNDIPNYTLEGALFNLTLRTHLFIQGLFGSIWPGLAIFTIWLSKLRRRGTWHILAFCIWCSLQLVHIPHGPIGSVMVGARFLSEPTGFIILCMSHAIFTDFKQISIKYPRLTKWVGTGALILCLSISILQLDAVGKIMRDWVSDPLWIKHYVEQHGIQKAVLFVKFPSDYDLRRDFIANDPEFKNSIIYARDREEENKKLFPYFPGYQFYLVDLERKLFSLLH